MHTIVDHEFQRNSEGELTLILDVLSFEEAEEPVLLVSKDEDTAYLRRSKGDVHEIVGIHDEIIGDLRNTDFILIIEMTGADITHGYSVPTALLEDDETDDIQTLQ